ncbi:hypothetical protein D3C80_2002610 [compost metagenome]
MGEQLEFRLRQAPFTVAQGAVAMQLDGDFLGDLQCLGVSVDDRDVSVRWWQ